MSDSLNVSVPRRSVVPLNVDSLVGGDILSLIIHGMYASPLAIYREYLQNAADAIASSGNFGDGKVEIKIDLGGRCVTIRDSGPGLSYAKAKRELIPISRSGKCRQIDRGFRGIGRLSGLAFGESVTFLTRCNEQSPVTQVVWNGGELRNGIDKKRSVEQVILQCTTIEKLDGSIYPANFFEVQVNGIARHAASLILNRDAVREYLGEICPVPFGADFPYISDVASLFEGSQPPLTLDVHLNEENTPITRPHIGGMHVSRERFDKFGAFEEIRVAALGDGPAAVGWLAHTSYLGAHLKTRGVRSLRARVGNIQVGDETAFDHLFSENRFNRWCVGEIHILDPRVVPNGRRDYFEPSVHLRNLENHLGAICRKLEQRCRTASRKRSQRRQFDFFLERLESTYGLVTSGYLTASASQKFMDGPLSEIPAFREKYAGLDSAEGVRRLDEVERKLKNLQLPRSQRSLAGVSAKDAPVYMKMFQVIAAISSSPREAKETIDAILKYGQR